MLRCIPTHPPPELRRNLLAALLLLIPLINVGCKSSAPVTSTNRTTESRTITDEFGRTVSIRTNPQRIISLAPSVTEILFALDLGDRVVGVTSYCDFPVEAKAREKVGDTIQPNLERLIGLKPDLVIVTTSSQLEKLTRQLDDLKIPVYVSNPRTVREVIASIQRLGEITDATARAQQLTDEMKRRVAAVEQQVQAQSKPRVFYVLQNAPLITAGRNTFINDLITLAGGVSISAAEEKDYPQYSRETATARNPEVIVIPESHGTEMVNEAELRRDFAVTAAVKNNRVVKVNPDLTDRPGPRLIEGLEQLANAIHAEKKPSQ